MAYSGSEDEGIGLEDADFDHTSDGDDDIDDDILDALEGDLAREAAAEEATEADEVRFHIGWPPALCVVSNNLTILSGLPF